MTLCRITRCENIVRESVITPFDLLIMAQIFKNNGHEVFFKDANADNIDYFQLSDYIQKIKPDVTIFHASQDCFMYDLETAKIAKLAGSKTVLINWTFKTMIDEVHPDIKEWVDCFVLNHSYMVDSVTSNVKVVHVNLNDKTIERFETKDGSCIGTLYFPIDERSKLEPGYKYV